jgi:hypothetical protein
MDQQLFQRMRFFDFVLGETTMITLMQLSQILLNEGIHKFESCAPVLFLSSRLFPLPVGRDGGTFGRCLSPIQLLPGNASQSKFSPLMSLHQIM